MALRAAKGNSSQPKALKVSSEFKATVVKSGKELEHFTLQAKHEHEAWSMACLEYSKQHPDADLADITILISPQI